MPELSIATRGVGLLASLLTPRAGTTEQAAALLRALGVDAAPLPPGHWRPCGTRRLLRQGPDRWLLWDERAGAAVVPMLAAALDGVAIVTDLGQAWCRWRLQGAAAADLVAQACGGVPAASALRVAWTRFADVPAIVLRDEAGFELFIARSYAPWLRDWLADAVGTAV